MKKILSLVLVLVLALTAIGGTLAYFTDTEEATNTFTVGNVEIDLIETFDEDEAVLMPGKKIQKIVNVKNEGTSDAYVRVHIGIPSNLDDGDPNFAAINNFVHFNAAEASLVSGQWNWGTKAVEGRTDFVGAGDKWNFYQTNVGGVDYNVYVVTYEAALAPDATTLNAAMTQVYLDASVDGVYNANDNTITYKDNKGHEVIMAADGKLNILVFAEGGQIDTFADAFDALNTQFGVPSAAANPWNKYGK